MRGPRRDAAALIEPGVTSIGDLVDEGHGWHGAVDSDGVGADAAGLAFLSPLAQILPLGTGGFTPNLSNDVLVGMGADGAVALARSEGLGSDSPLPASIFADHVREVAIPLRKLELDGELVPTHNGIAILPEALLRRDDAFTFETPPRGWQAVDASLRTIIDGTHPAGQVDTYAEIRALEHFGDQLSVHGSDLASSVWLIAAQRLINLVLPELKQFYLAARGGNPKAYTEASFELALNVQYARELLRKADQAPAGAALADEPTPAEYRPGSEPFSSVVSGLERALSAGYLGEAERILSEASHREPLEGLRRFVAL